MSIQFHVAGYGFRHPRPFTIDRPRGLPEWVLLQFTHPAQIADGARRILAEPGSVAVFAPGQRQFYRGHGIGLGNHWCHATGLEALVRDLGIGTGVPHTIASPAAVDGVFRSLVEEERCHRPGWEAETAALLVRLLRSLAGGGPQSGLPRLRGEVMAALDQTWSVSELARRADCSIPTLHRRWRQAFGRSPLDDLIAARLERARWLVAVAGHRISDAARAVGYDDPRYFARLCRRHTGSAPSAWLDDEVGTA
jgi:AraC-like DNA-binding protein